MDILATIRDLEKMIGDGSLPSSDLPAAIGLLTGLRVGYIQGREDAIRDATDQFLVDQVRGDDEEVTSMRDRC